jgi:hypothetical protein
LIIAHPGVMGQNLPKSTLINIKHGADQKRGTKDEIQWEGEPLEIQVDDLFTKSLDVSPQLITPLQPSQPLWVRARWKKPDSIWSPYQSATPLNLTPPDAPKLNFTVHEDNCLIKWELPKDHNVAHITITFEQKGLGLGLPLEVEPSLGQFRVPISGLMPYRIHASSLSVERVASSSVTSPWLRK